MRKIILILIVLGLGAAVWKFWPRAASQEEKTAADQPQAIPVKLGSLRVVVDTSGRVVPHQEVEIKCKASGEVMKLPLDVSEPVKKGDLLLQLDPQDESRSVKRSEVALAVSEAKLVQARLNLKIAEQNLHTERNRAQESLKSREIELQESKAKLERIRQLLAKNMSSIEENEAAQTNCSQATTELENARMRIEDLKAQETAISLRKEDVRIAEAQVESDQLSLSDVRRRLADTEVMAPIDGVVAERNVQVGQIIASAISNVGGGTTVMKIVDLSRIYILASVDESDIGRVQTEQSVVITVDAYPEMTFPGKVVRVATKGMESSNVVTFEVKIEVEGPRRKMLKPAMTAAVEIVAVEKENVLLVPSGAINRRRNQTFVMVQGQNGAEERVVETGASGSESVEIKSGLKEGELVLVRGLTSSRWANDDSDRARRRMQMQMIGGRRR